MKNKYIFAGLLFLLLPTYSFAEVLTVQTKKAPIRSEPYFLGKILTNASYQDSVEVLQKKETWWEVRFGKHQGWIHISALNQSKLNLKAGNVINYGVSGEEVSLAGKGFNAAVEQAYRSQHGNMGYAWVDKMEQIQISSDELERFSAESDFQ